MQESKPSDLNLTAFHVKWWVLTSFSPRGSQIKPHHVLLSQAGERERDRGRLQWALGPAMYEMKFK